MQDKAAIRAQLQNDILSWQGHKPACAAAQTDFGLGCIVQSFPNAVFPIAALHEFSCAGSETVASSSAFITGLLSSLMVKGGVSLWVSSSKRLFPPGLKHFGINPDQIIFLHSKKEKEVLWAVEEALRCNALTAVVGELNQLDFATSRRFQLAIEGSGVGCFILQLNPCRLTTASTARWHIKPLPSRLENGLPGVGYACWHVDLQKVRNGKPGSWDVEWIAGKFRPVSKLAIINEDWKKATG